MRRWIVLAVTGCLVSCGPPGRYIPPSSPPVTAYSREVNASFDATWSAVTNVAGATFFSIKNFDKGSGLMTLDYSNLRAVSPYIDCGTMSGGTTLINVPGTPPTSVLNYTTLQQLTLKGTGNITIRSGGARRTLIQINSLYDLRAIHSAGQETKLDGEWKFTTQEPDTEGILVDFIPISVTCQPSYKLEQDFLNAVSSLL